MKNIKDICVIVQARLGSERVPAKMLKNFADTTLMDIICKKILKSKSIPKDNFFLSIHEQELLDNASKYNLNVFHRSEKSAKSEGTPLTDMYEWWNKLPFKYCILLNACAPFMKIETIDGFVEAYKNSSSDGLFGIMKKKNYFWNTKGTLVTNWPEGQACMNTKFVETTYEASHCLYAGRMDLIGEGIWMGDFTKPGDIELFPMKEEECLDIDHQWQFDMCEIIYKNRKQ